jgi:KDO2-lipid IV(A) lauroyltransferase
MSLANRAVEWGYAAGWRLVRLLPERAAWALFRGAADRAARRRGPGTQRLAQNLRRVVGPDLPEAEFDLLVRDALRSYARYWMEAFRIVGRTREGHLAGWYMHNWELLKAATDQGNGAILVLPHSGNWDAAGAWVVARGWKLTTVAERLKPEGLYQRFVAYRETLGMEIIPAKGGERAPIDILAERLRENTVVPLLADRDLSARGVEVTFFSGRTRMPAGPALLAVRTGAPIFVIHSWYDEHMQPYGVCEGPLALPDADSGNLEQRVRAITQLVADKLGEGIAKHPADWHMLQKLWLDDAKPRAPKPDEAEPAGAAVGEG